MPPKLTGIKLNHVGIPSRNPEKLAAWYAEHFGLMLDGAFAYGDGWQIACEEGEPLTNTVAHFGFMFDNKKNVTDWVDYFSSQGVTVEMTRDDNAAFIADPEGNVFEFFWDTTDVKIAIQ
jgi:catechol 2,3-dioxygenase-like lactoylglutathione lyase family enzyme